MNNRIISFFIILSIMLTLASCQGLPENPNRPSSNNTSDAVSADHNSDNGSTGEFTPTELPPKTIDDFLTCLYTETDYNTLVSYFNEFKRLALEGEDTAEFRQVYETMEELIDYLDSHHTIANLAYYLEMTEAAADKYSEMDNYVNEAIALYDGIHAEIYNSDSPLKDGIFEDWDENELLSLLNSDPEAVKECNNRLTELMMESLEVDEDSDDYHLEMNTLYEEYVRTANELAVSYGYDNYYEYMADTAYSVDYPLSQREEFREYVAEYIAELAFDYTYAVGEIYKSDIYNSYQIIMLTDNSYKDLPEDYLNGFISTFDGSIEEKMRSLFEDGRMLFGDENSNPIACTTDLPYYDEIVCAFTEGYYQSLPTVVHEMGHFVAMHCYDGADASYELLETHSQGSEWLLYYYLKDELDPELYEMFYMSCVDNALFTLLSAAIIDEFEYTVYTAEEPYSASEFDELLRDICDKYHEDAYDMLSMRSYIKMVYMQSPVYYMSYATSCLASMEFYIIAEEEGYEAAQEAHRIISEDYPEEGFIENLSHAGISDPFDERTFAELTEFFALN